MTTDTIFALSSGRPPAAIAVIRISGPGARDALQALTGRVPEPRRAALRPVGPCPLPTTLRPSFERAARDTSLPISMLVAVGKVESNLRVDARSGAGARGLLQLLPSTAAALQLNVDDPEANVL
ncbi:MAG: tRNA modification GTPase, partial [Variibacter sp.]|nr:tRNA modification GTPase [Variibacter sp.]